MNPKPSRTLTPLENGRRAIDMDATFLNSDLFKFILLPILIFSTRICDVTFNTMYKKAIMGDSFSFAV
jgi:hypothetical protein